MRLLKQHFRDRRGTLKQTKNWYVEFRDHNDNIQRVPAFTSKAASDELRRNLEKLISYHKATGGQFDPSLECWLADLPRAVHARLVKHGLISLGACRSEQTACRTS